MQSVTPSNGVLSNDERGPELDASTWGALETLGRAFHVEQDGLQPVLEAILRAAVSSIDGTDFAGVNLVSGDVFVPQAVFGEPPNALDALQQRTNTGPCIDSARFQQVIRVDDMDGEQSWPEYAALALSLGVRSMLCTPMRVDSLRLGSISLYSTSPTAFDAVAERLAVLLGLHAAIALADARRRENLATALHNRDTIGQAKGILMERHRITADAAFGLLTKASQRTHRKVAAIADELAKFGVIED